VLDASALVAAGLPAASADAFWPTLGYACGNLAQTRVPALTGIAHLRPTRDELKAFAAAFGTSGAAALFHIVGVTPEAADLQTALGAAGSGEGVETLRLSPEHFASAWLASRPR